MTSILFYAPNLIGYLRFFLLLVSWHYAMTHPNIYFWSYTISMLLDAVDGMVARKLN